MSYAEQEDLVPGLLRKIAALEAENAKLRAVAEAVKEALQFYANYEHLETRDQAAENGSIAHKALKKLEDIDG